VAISNKGGTQFPPFIFPPVLVPKIVYKYFVCQNLTFPFTNIDS